MTETEKWISESLKSLPHLCAEVRRLSEENDILRARLAKETGSPPPNDPLTLEELRWMSGEPIWITGERFSSRWDLIRRLMIPGMSTYTLGFLAWEDCGKTWLAYRRKPEEDTL